MKIRSLAYHIKDGFKNIHRNKMFSLASIATITACIFLFGVFYSIVVNFQYMIKKAETEVCVTVFFDENLSETDIKKLGDEISKIAVLRQLTAVAADIGGQVPDDPSADDRVVRHNQNGNDGVDPAAEAQCPGLLDGLILPGG